jgi:hypothetical protein
MHYCVRLCDGRYFPILRYATVTPAQLCSALCPASDTKIFSGGNIASAIAADGTRYGGLQNAFFYRKQLASDCTCNGRDHFGLAPIDPNSDPTARRGDILMTAAGPVTVVGAKRTTAQRAGPSLSN